VPAIHEVPRLPVVFGGILVLLGIAMALRAERGSSTSDVPILKDGLGEAQR